MRLITAKELYSQGLNYQVKAVLDECAMAAEHGHTEMAFWENTMYGHIYSRLTVPEVTQELQKLGYNIQLKESHYSYEIFQWLKPFAPRTVKIINRCALVSWNVNKADE